MMLDDAWWCLKMLEKRMKMLWENAWISPKMLENVSLMLENAWKKLENAWKELENAWKCLEMLENAWKKHRKSLVKL